MKRTKEDYVKLMNIVDDNYKMIEEETQEHFEEFLEKWKELAKSKIKQYKDAFNKVKVEKEEIQTRLEPIVTDLIVGNKKLTENYEKLLEKYNNDIENERGKAKEKEELLKLQYEEELSALKQGKLELEGLLDEMKTQKDGYEKTVFGLKRKMKERTETRKEEVKAITENYIADCAKLVVARIVDAVEAKNTKETLEYSSKKYTQEIARLQKELNNLEEHKTTLKDKIKDVTNSYYIGAKDPVNFSKYDELTTCKNKIIKEIQTWKNEFEKNEGRKCEKSDCEPIRNLFQNLKKIKNDIADLKGEEVELNDSIVSLDLEDGMLVEELKRENEDLKKELQNLKVSFADKVPETEAIKLLKSEIESLNKSKEQLRAKNKELEEKAIKEAAQSKEALKNFNKLHEENNKLQAKVIALNSEGPEREDLANLKEEYNKILTENQEQQRALQRLEPMEVKLLDLENKYKVQEIAYQELKEKYKQVGLERLAVGKKLLKMEQLEEERLKARNELIKAADKSPQAQILKELEKENEILKKQLIDVEGESKNLQQQIGKLRKDKEELLGQLDRVKLLEEEAPRLESTKQKLVAAEEDARQLRLQIAMRLPEAPKDMTTIIKDDYEKLVTENKTLKEKIDNLEKKVASLKEVKKNYDDKIYEIFQLKQDLKVLQVDYEQNTKKLGEQKELKMKIAELRKQLADKVPGEASNVRQEMRKVLEEKKELEEKMEEIEELKKKILQVKAVADNNLAELEEVKQELKKTELERDRYIAKANKANEYMMERNNLRVQLAKKNEVNAKVVKDSNMVSPVTMELERMQNENTKLVKNLSTIDKVKKESSAKDNRIKELEGKLKGSKDRIKELELIVNKSNESKIKEIIDKHKIDMKEVEKLLEKERQMNKALSLEMDKKTKMYDQLRENESKDLQEQIKKLEAQRKQDLTLLQKASSEESAKKAKELENARAMIAKLTEETTSLTGIKTDLESKNTILSQNVKRLETELARIGAEASKVIVLRDTVDKLTAQIEKNNTDYKIMEDKYKDEMLKRKKLHNMIEDMKGKIRVYCRIRPPNQQEINMNSPVILNVVDELTLKVNTKHGPKTFNFDSVFGPGTSQVKVFEDTKRLIQSAIDGYNVCIFAYGQTGAGKTFTIQGNDANPGIAPRSFTEMYQIIASMNNYNVKLECYMVELYIDTLTDLLLPKEMRKNPPSLDIKEDAKGMIYIQDVTKYPIKSAEDAKRIFDLGLLNRKTSATQMNQTSSRSHLIFSILVETINKQTKQRAVGKLSFVDLAGSERADKAGTSAERLKEGRAINKSLSALGNVISKLSTGGNL